MEIEHQMKHPATLWINRHNADELYTLIAFGPDGPEPPTTIRPGLAILWFAVSLRDGSRWAAAATAWPAAVDGLEWYHGAGFVSNTEEFIGWANDELSVVIPEADNLADDENSFKSASLDINITNNAIVCCRCQQPIVVLGHSEDQLYRCQTDGCDWSSNDFTYTHLYDATQPIGKRYMVLSDAERLQSEMVKSGPTHCTADGCSKPLQNPAALVTGLCLVHRPHDPATDTTALPADVPEVNMSSGIPHCSKCGKRIESTVNIDDDGAFRAPHHTCPTADEQPPAAPGSVVNLPII